MATPMEMVTLICSPWKTKRDDSTFSRRPSASMRAPSRFVSGSTMAKLLAAVAREHLVTTDASLDDAREILEHEVPGQVPVEIVDLLEVVDVEHHEGQIAHVPARADDLLLHRLEEVALHVRLGETIDDGHPVDFLVVLRFHVLPGQIFEDGRARP